jgi:hypothetical protein
MFMGISRDSNRIGSDTHPRKRVRVRGPKTHFGARGICRKPQFLGDGVLRFIRSEGPKVKAVRGIALGFEIVGLSE